MATCHGMLAAAATSLALIELTRIDATLWARNMAVFIALLRAVNVGGTGKLPMQDLKRLCEDAGFQGVRTYIASGNVIFESEQTSAQVKAALAEKLHHHASKPVGVLVRTASEMAAILLRNPFPGAAPDRTVAIFLDEPPAADALTKVTGRQGEALWLETREIYIHYPDGIGRSKLKVPAAKEGTARNMNTVAKLASIAGERAASRPR